MPLQIRPQLLWQRWQQRKPKLRPDFTGFRLNRQIWLKAALPAVILLAGLAIYGLAGYYLPLNSHFNAPVRLITVVHGSTSRTISDQLYEEKIISSRTLFRVASRVTRLDSRLKAGKYALSPKMSMAQIIRTLYQGKVVTVQVTIPEGFTLAKIRERLAAVGLVSKEDFDRLVADPSRIYGGSMPSELAGVKNLEGFLFPDTYRFGSDQSATVVIRTMVDRFLEVAAPIYRKSAVKKKLTFREYVVLASVVEAETANNQEKPIVASVFLNRLQQKMPLQSCATINYLLPKPKARLYEKDLAINSPYNTYLHQGLPPSPISSPGQAALEAVANPASDKYLYFVAKGDGTHYFSRTYSEHLKAQRTYMK